MVINFEELHPQERAELERNIFFFYIGTVEGMARSNSLWPMTFGLACCAIRNDGSRLITLRFRSIWVIFSDFTKTIGRHDCVRNGNEENGTYCSAPI